MNISLAKAKEREKFAFGLNAPNSRKEGGEGTKASSVFGDDDSEPDSDDGDDRAAVNRDLRAEQEALRKRAAASMEAAAEYDYDGVYDEMHTASSNKPTEPQEKKSRYIGELLKAAKQRERERDIIHERKMARELAQEETEYLGKDKFVTKAYKQKLAERELWVQEEEARRLEEEKEDVTKKTGDGAFASFYGNFNRNVAMGGSSGKEETTTKDLGVKDGPILASISQKPPSSLGFIDGFEQAAPESNDEKDAHYNDESNKSESSVAAPPSPMSMRKAREEKLAKARIRYFQRQGLSKEEARRRKQ
jgi:coiled-coil domain-containing protein 55